MLDKYLDYIQFEKRYAKHTFTSYQTDLKQFTEFVNIHFPNHIISKADHRIVRSWIVELMDKGVGPRSINRKISALKSFYRFLEKRGFIEINPMRKIVSPKVGKRLPAYFREETMDDLFSRIEFNADFEGIRDHLILMVLYHTGIRKSELIGLKASDINFSNATFSVLGKGGKQRLVPFTPALQNLLVKYLAIRKEINKYNKGELFLTKKGEVTYPKLIFRITNKYLSYVSTQDKKGPHTIRHTFATHLANNGAELNAIKELLGHANLAATQIYTHNSIEKLKSAYKMAHPKALKN